MTPGFPVSLFEAIAEAVDAELALISDMSGPAPGSDPFADGTFDLGWICSTSFVDLALRTSTPSVKLAGIGWAPSDAACAGRPVYFSELVVPANSDARSLSDLRGTRIGCNDPVSLSGHYALRFAIDDLGESADLFAELVFTGGHMRSLERVAGGQLDAAVVDSIVLARSRQGSGPADQLRVIDRLGPWPVQPLVARNDLTQETIEHVRAALLDANRDPRMQQELQLAALDGFVETTPNHYATVREAMVRTHSL